MGSAPEGNKQRLLMRCGCSNTATHMVVAILTGLVALFLTAQPSDGQGASSDLVAAAQEGRVDLLFTGRAPTYLQPLLSMEAKLKQGDGFSGHLPYGQVLRSKDPAYCDMVIQQLEQPIDLVPGVKQTSGVFAYCLQVAPKERKFPISGVQYGIATEPASSVMIDLLRSLSMRNADTWESYPAQLAVWAVSSGRLSEAALEEFGGFRDLSSYWPEVATLLNEAGILRSPDDATAPAVDTATSVRPQPSIAITPSITPQPTDTTSPIAAGRTSDRMDWMLWLIVGVAGLLVCAMAAGVILSFRIRAPVHEPPVIESTYADSSAWGDLDSLRATPRTMKSAPTFPSLGQAGPAGVTRANASGSLSSKNMTRRLPQKPSVPMPQSIPDNQGGLLPNPRANHGAQDKPAIKGVPTERVAGTVVQPNPSNRATEGRGQKPIVLRVVNADDGTEVEYSLPPGGGLLSREALPFFELRSEGVSDPHAMIRKEGSSVYVRDLFSFNGTRINNQPITSGSDRQLRDGDTIEFGTCRVTYHEHNQCLIDEVTRNKLDLRTSGPRWLVSRNQLPFAQYNQAYLSDKTVSIPHAKLESQHGAFILRDLFSSNGTHINSDDDRVIPGERRLISNGTQIILGRMTLEVRVQDTNLQRTAPIDKRYQVIGLQAEGGMATIYIVKDLKEMNVRRALKMPAPKHMQNKGQARQEILDAFRQEQEISQNVSHPNLVKVHAVGTDEKQGPYLVMDLVEGHSLRQILAESRAISPPMAAEIVCQIGEGLQVLHNAGWVHCDVKPDNILINAKQNQAVLIDFGVAKRIGSTEARRFGSLEYLPESYQSSAAATPAFDVYSLATTMYEMLKGERCTKDHNGDDQDDASFGGTRSAQDPRFHNHLDISEKMFDQVPQDVAAEAVEILERVLDEGNPEATLKEFQATMSKFRSKDLFRMAEPSTN